MVRKTVIGIIVVALSGCGAPGQGGNSATKMGGNYSSDIADMTANDAMAGNLEEASNMASGMPAPAAEAAPQPAADSGAGRSPSYDTNGYCAEVAGVAGGSYVIERTCRQQEAEARGDIRRMSIPGRVYNYCDEVASVGAGGSYVIFRTCVEQELGAAADLG